MRQIDIDSRFAYNRELMREAEHYRLVKQTLMNKPKRIRTIYIPISPVTLTRKVYKSIVIWLAGLFPDLACQYNWIPCDN